MLSEPMHILLTYRLPYPGTQDENGAHLMQEARLHFPHDPLELSERFSVILSLEIKATTV